MAADPVPTTAARMLQGHRGAINAIRFNGTLFAPLSSTCGCDLGP